MVGSGERGGANRPQCKKVQGWLRRLLPTTYIDAVAFAGRVWVLAPFGDNALNQTFPTVLFTPAFTSVYPTQVSTYGGELITLKASGFNATLLQSDTGKSFFFEIAYQFSPSLISVLWQSCTQSERTDQTSTL